jgi:hypothetical protein
MARLRLWPFVQHTAVHDLSKIAELSPSVMNARLLSDRSLYILQNLAAQDAVLVDRYATEIDSLGYYVVEDTDPEYADYIWASNQVALELSLDMSIYPKTATMWHDEMGVKWGGAKVQSFPGADQRYKSQTFQSPQANGDSWFNYFWCRAGVYNLHLLGSTSNNRAKLDLAIDDETIVTGQDWYSAGDVANVIHTVSEVEIPDDGQHILQAVVNGRHASSTGWYIVLTKYWLEWVNIIGV